MANDQFASWSPAAAIAVLSVCSIAAGAPVTYAGQSREPAAGVVASITVTGCLERWNSDEAVATTGAPSDQPPAGVHYMLTRIEGQAASATAAGGGTPAKPAYETRYLLLTKTAEDYDRQLGHTVKIVGTIAPQPTEGARPAERAADPSRNETNLPSGPERRSYRDNLIEVSSLALVAPRCGK